MARVLVGTIVGQSDYQPKILFYFILKLKKT
jgi:hypothetical protein